MVMVLLNGIPFLMNSPIFRPDGRKYTGEYVDDKKHGRGVFEWYFYLFFNSKGLMEEFMMENGLMENSTG